LPGSYKTRSGDTWDGIALRALGSEFYMHLMMDANPSQIWTARFDAGVELVVPDLPAPAPSTNLPPWRLP
jgi:phage tail protein X